VVGMLLLQQQLVGMLQHPWRCDCREQVLRRWGHNPMV
jgi:hypothetical protein